MSLTCKKYQNEDFSKSRLVALFAEWKLRAAKPSLTICFYNIFVYCFTLS